jgi:hypothetical protein
MTHLFADYEVSILAREKGFDANCLAVYMNGEFQIPRGFSMAIVTKTQVDLLKGKAILAPLWDQLIEWLETKNIWITIHPPFEDLKFEWSMHRITSKGKLGKRLGEGFDYISKQEARRAAILHALTII